MKKVNIGSLPPPLGGVSVYLSRLQQNERDDIFIDDKTLSKRKFLKLSLRSDIHIVLQGFSYKKILLLYFCSFFVNNKFSIVIHSMKFFEFYNKSNEFFQRKIIRAFLRRCTVVQAVSSDIKRELMIIEPTISNKIVVKAAFLPPNPDDEGEIWKSYSAELLKFLEEHSIIIIANASQLVFWDNVDLYGLDMCIDLMNVLKKDNNDIGLIFALANAENNAKYLEEKMELIKSSNLEKQIFFMTGQKELWPLFKKANLLIRPTCTDGDAVSIREALYFGCPVVASDVCERPSKVKTFSNRNIDSFITTVKMELNIADDF